MAEQTVDVLISGGKATAAPPLGPALGPLGVNIGQVVAEINKKTASFAGMQVPVKVIVETSNKSFTIEIGTPPTAELIKKEANIKKGAGNPITEKVADLKMADLIKIAGMKEDAMLGNSVKARVKEAMGTCRSMGVTVEGLPSAEALKKLNAGDYDSAFN